MIGLTTRDRNNNYSDGRGYNPIKMNIIAMAKPTMAIAMLC